MGAYAAAVLAEAPRAYWKLNEAPGAGVAADSGSHGFAGAAAGVTFGEAGLVAAEPGTAAEFDGTAVVTFADPTGGTIISQGWTVEAWVSPGVLALLAPQGLWNDPAVNWDDEEVEWDSPRTGAAQLAQHIAGIAVLSPTTGYELAGGAGICLLNGAPVASFSPDGLQYKQAIGPAQLQAGKTYHLAGTFDPAAAELRIFVNGALAASRLTIGAVPVRAAPLNWRALGHARGDDLPDAEPNRPYTGRMAHVAVYDRPLAVATILRHYQLGTGWGLSVDQPQSGVVTAGLASGADGPSSS